LTITLWYNLKSIPCRDVHPALIDRTNAHEADGYRIFIEGNQQKIGVGLLTSTWIDSYLDVPLDTDRWHFLAVTYDGAVLLVYQDGMLVLEDNRHRGPIRYSSETSLGIGRRQTGASWGLNGKLDDIRIYSRALTAEELFELQRSGSSESLDARPAHPLPGSLAPCSQSFEKLKKGINQPVYEGGKLTRLYSLPKDELLSSQLVDGSGVAEKGYLFTTPRSSPSQP
jgi:hypothetical protein